MVVRNMGVLDGLANGSTGQVIDFKYSTCRRVTAVLVKFDNAKVGRNARQQSSFDMSGFSADIIPIVRVEVSFSPNDNNLKVTRRQFPFRLCWACTIHRVQGATLPKIAISFERGLRSGQAYVALSRSKTLDGIYIKGFRENQIKVDQDVVVKMKRMFKEAQAKKPFDLFDENSFSIAVLNARSARLHFKDAISHPFLSESDILFVAETNIAKNQAHLFQITDRKLIFLPYIPASNCHGVAMYIRSNMFAEECATFTYSYLELLCVSISSENMRKKICLVYRSPSTQIRSFIDKMCEWTTETNPDIIVGDMNIDTRSRSYENLVNALPSYSQVVQNPTHISGSTLDLAFYHRQYPEPMVNIFEIYFSDHSIVHLTLKDRESV